MRKSLALLKRFAREDNGASMVEYAVLVGLISAAIIATIGLLSGAINTEFNDLLTALNGNG